MPRKLSEYNLLFSCPGDAYEECYSAIQTAVDDFNRYAKSSLSISVNLTHWSTDSYPQSGDHPQTLLNIQMVDTADAAIAVFWTRFGTPTDEYGSGTEEEIERLINENKQVFLYFLDKAVPPSLTDSETYQKQRRQVALFREKYENKGIYWVVADENKLKEQFAQHLFLYFAKKVSEDTGISAKSEKSALTITAVDGSNKAQVQYLNLSIKMGIEKRKQAIIKKIKEVQGVTLPISTETAKSEKQESLLKLTEATSKLYENLAKSVKVAALFPSKKDASFSEEDKRIVTDFCRANGLDIFSDFWNLGGLQVEISRLFNVMGSSKDESLVGSEDAKQKYITIKETISDIYQYTDSSKYYSEMDKIPFVEFVAHNEGTTFDEDIEIDLLLPHNSLIKADEFPVPLFELDEIVEKNRIDDWLYPVVTADIGKFDYSPSYGSNIMPYIPPVLPFQQRDYIAEYNHKKEEYYERMKELMDWKVFTQGAVDTIKIQIKKLNQFKSMHLPSRLFLKSVPNKIEYTITAKYTPSVIKGEIEIYK